MLYGYPLDGVVLTIGCDKTTPACLMAAATVNIPAIALSVGPMLNGWYKGKRTGSGTIVWKARELLATGRDRPAGLHQAGGVFGALDRLLQHDGHGDDDELPDRGARHVAARLGGDPGAVPRPAGMRLPHRPQIVEMVRADRKPSDILTREAFINAIVVNSAIGGSTNAPIHLDALARHVGVELDIDDWQSYGSRHSAARESAARRRISRRGLSTAPAACRPLCRRTDARRADSTRVR